MTYLEIVNRVLRRLREQEVQSLTANTYSTIIADLVNEVKRDVENAWNWSALRETITVETAADLYNYTLTTSGTRFRVIDVINDTSNFIMRPATTREYNSQFLVGDFSKGAPITYNFNGVSSAGDTQVDIFPIPDAVYNVRFNLVIPQDDLVLSTDELLIPAPLVVEGTIARAISERGEDGGFQEQEQRFRSTLADYIAIESGQRPEETIWYTR
ncbi:hypothetical protein UFOVP369_47 [uncultured Caudovirales phage]|uniref:Gp6 domain containing protein n=1 Tax=uncultured Caudovirales phage TaxID=2100421 RepID=A0A6J7X6Z1_9CAUD|nr:hypothetical protein UFOVP369_47 [uncultured Caudovirales phage]